MSLPTSRELREMLDEATSYPWQKEWGFIIASDREPGRVLADLWGAYGGVRARKEDIDLMLIAPQLAEEVIRLREAIEDEIRSLRAPLCSHMPDGDELDEYLEEWEMRGYAAHILARILEGEE